MSWNILQSDSFSDWFNELSDSTKKDILRAVSILEEKGPLLGRPFVDTLKGSNLTNLKELRVQSLGNPFRIIFVFDPKRNAILLVGSNKKGVSRFYEKMISEAEEIYKEYLEVLNEEKE